jgi:hypothetical protein
MAGHHGNRIVTDGLIFYMNSRVPKGYPGSGTHSYDIAGDYNMILNNGVGWDGKSFTFDGVDDHISVDIISSVTDHTTSIWFKSTSIVDYKNVFDFNTTYGSGNAGIRIEQYTSPGFSYYWPNISSNGNARMSVTMNDSGSDYCGIGGDCPGNLQSGVWSNLVISYNDTTPHFSVYFDGVKIVSNQTMTANFYGSMSDFVIGSGYYNSRSFQGDIQSLAIWNRELTDDEVARNYESEKTKFL